ncbi:MAG: SOS response-associated peptidase, partial [Pseudomonadota bacterium]
MKSAPAEVAALFGLDVRDNFPPRYNICPTQPVAAIRQNERRQREYALMRWGFVPSWAKGEFLDKLAKRPMINARSETVLEKASFRSAFKRRRCLIPADGFYEWKAAGETNSARQPFAIHRADEALFAFGGVWETAVDPDGGEIDTLAILTTAAGPDLHHVHHREPVVIAPDHFGLWLEADERDSDMIAELLHPAAPGDWALRPVSTDVNSVRN